MPFNYLKGVALVNNAQLYAKLQILDGKWVDFYPF
jgi:hypothetical protein